jgi:hypothetical protein
MDWIKEFFAKGWPMLRDAPFPFIVMFVLGFLVCKIYYHREMSLYRAAMGFTEEQRRRVTTEKYLKKYPPQKRGREKGYELIWTGSGAVFLHDFRTQLRHHVANTETMSDLRFDWHRIRTVSSEELDRIKKGEPINTRV